MSMREMKILKSGRIVVSSVNNGQLAIGKRS